MQLKNESVNIWGLQVEMQPVLKIADSIWASYGKELVITSGRDSIHSAGSLHYYGYAVDLRTNYFTEDVKQQVASALKSRLPNSYQVIVHDTHIHVEYQRVLDKLYVELHK